MLGYSWYWSQRRGIFAPILVVKRNTGIPAKKCQIYALSFFLIFSYDLFPSFSTAVGNQPTVMKANEGRRNSSPPWGIRVWWNLTGCEKCSSCWNNFWAWRQLYLGNQTFYKGTLVLFNISSLEWRIAESRDRLWSQKLEGVYTWDRLPLSFVSNRPNGSRERNVHRRKRIAQETYKRSRDLYVLSNFAIWWIQEPRKTRQPMLNSAQVLKTVQN